MNYIGVDCHISTLDFAVVNEKGTVSQRAKVNTGVKEFMEFVKSIPKPRKIFIEEGELAGWVYALWHGTQKCDQVKWLKF